MIVLTPKRSTSSHPIPTIQHCTSWVISKSCFPLQKSRFPRKSSTGIKNCTVSDLHFLTFIWVWSVKNYFVCLNHSFFKWLLMSKQSVAETNSVFTCHAFSHTYDHFFSYQLVKRTKMRKIDQMLVTKKGINDLQYEWLMSFECKPSEKYSISNGNVAR